MAMGIILTTGVAKVKDKKKTKVKVETVSDKPVIPGAPPPNKAVKSQDVAQR